MSGHLYYAECLLEGCETDSDDQTACKSRQGDVPSFQNEDLPDQSILGSHAAECPDILLLLDDKHGEASEDVEGDDDDDEDQNHEYGGLLIFHHLVERFVLLEAVLDLESGAKPCADFLLEPLQLIFRAILSQPEFNCRDLVVIFQQFLHFFDRNYKKLGIHIIVHREKS